MCETRADATGRKLMTDTADVLEARALDARGQHSEAIRLLDQAIARGDAAAMTSLGKRILVAEAPGREPVEAVELITQAANLGNTEAALQLSVLAATGMHHEQDWHTALAAVIFAAEQGSAVAQGQLRTLAADRELAAIDAADADSKPSLWEQLAATVDLNGWHRPTAGANLSESPLVRHFPDMITAEVCAWLIERVRGRLTRARVYDAAQKKETVSYTRDNTWAVFNITHADLVSVLVQVRMCANTGLGFRQLEPAVVLHYDVGEQISNHFDFIDPETPDYENEIARNGERIVTFLIYLNDDYSGGETELPELGICHKGQRGEGLFFVNIQEDGSADVRTVHAGRPTTSGEKWIVSQFIRNRPTF